MNKIKVLYDVVKTMKEKDIFKGIVTVEGTKDNVKVVSFVNEFLTNTVSGETKAKISTNIDLDGTKVKNESELEFNKKCCHGKMFHHGMKHHMHSEEHEGRCCGIKSKLSKAAFMLNVLNKIELEEKENQSILLSLNLKEVCKEIKDLHKNHMGMHQGHGDHKHHECMKEFLEMDHSDIQLNVLVNKNSEVEKITLSGNGKKKGEGENIHEMSFNGEVKLTW